MQGEYHWHEHTDDDEFFFVLEGRFLIDLEPQEDGVTPGASSRSSRARIRGSERRSASHARTGAVGDSDGRDGEHRSDRQLMSP